MFLTLTTTLLLVVELIVGPGNFPLIAITYKIKKELTMLNKNIYSQSESQNSVVPRSEAKIYTFSYSNQQRNFSKPQLKHIMPKKTEKQKQKVKQIQFSF